MFTSQLNELVSKNHPKSSSCMNTIADTAHVELRGMLWVTMREKFWSEKRLLNKRDSCSEVSKNDNVVGSLRAVLGSPQCELNRRSDRPNDHCGYTPLRHIKWKVTARCLQNLMKISQSQNSCLAVKPDQDREQQCHPQHAEHLQN